MLLNLLSSIKKIFYLFIHGRHREREAERHRQREKQAPCRKPDVGLDPGTPEWCPEPKADAQLPVITVSNKSNENTCKNCQNQFSPNLAIKQNI